MAKKRRVPEVLWKIFHNRARTLADTIISLLPSKPSLPSECICKGNTCLLCIGPEDALSLIITPSDPPHYRSLLNRCFVVVSENAPPFSLLWAGSIFTQHEFVKRTIESIMLQRPTPHNVLCVDYYKLKRSSPIVEILSSSEWHLLLKRVGDMIMLHLLKFSSIFLPFPERGGYHQVAGLPISNFCFNLKHTVLPEKQPHPCKRRKIDDEAVLITNKTQVAISQEREKQGSQMAVEKSKKRSREPRLQRRKRNRKLDIREIPILLSSSRDIIAEKSSICPDNKFEHKQTKQMPLQCHCCALFENLRQLDSEAQIVRKSMFYSQECSSFILPRKNLLNSLKANLSGANILFKDIFGIADANICAPSCSSPPNINCCHTNSKCIYHSVTKLLKALIRRAHCCKHAKLLEKHCSITSIEQNVGLSSGSTFQSQENKSGIEFMGNVHVKHQKKPVENVPGLNTKVCDGSSEAANSQFDLSQAYCSKNQVVSLIWAVCRSIVPEDMLGLPSNWRILRRNITRFIHLRRYEKFSLKQCMHGLKISKFPFLSTKHSFCNINRTNSQSHYHVHSIKRNVLESWIFWLFSNLVMPLVQANFYVTEHDHGKLDVFYYRLSVWEKFKTQAVSDLENENYSPITDSSVRMITSRRAFGFSKIRLCPKGNGVRVLANLKSSSRIPLEEHPLRVSKQVSNRKMGLHKQVRYKSFKPVNIVLRDFHAILKGLQTEEPEKLGSSVFDYNDVHKKLFLFLTDLMSKSATKPDVFVVVADVSGAFDSIYQDKLLTIMRTVLLDDDYILKRFQQVVCAKKSLWVHPNLVLVNRDMSGSAEVPVYPNGSFQSVLIRQDWSKRIWGHEISSILKEHVNNNILRFNKKFYKQNIGIPQGSILSSLLCSFYYGHMENSILLPFLKSTAKHSCIDEPPYVRSKYVLLRFIDDIIFISTSKKQATNMFTKLQKGFPEYNCYMNKQKFGMNFDVEQVSGNESKRVYKGEDGVPFLRWSGMFINCSTLEVQADYTRYLETHLSSTLTVNWQGKPGKHLKRKLRDYLLPKCHPIFYDSNINSAAVVRLNIYQVFLLCAMKFHCYVRDISGLCKFNPKSYIDSIEKSLRFMHKLLKRRMRSKKQECMNPILQIKKREVVWLGFVAYIRILKRKQSRYKDLLLLLRRKLLAHENATSCVSEDLKYAVDDSHSSVFWNIKY
ncbi:telomerase reverse transcriptase isoform X2 [Impatiens glandulifera]|uniref:telomerase reverse transcriptase isoform X2 n=1 Tax=Impatiens glandulifera TaxID=253017 RepID=UPI001FB0AF13|nr:telomerase reverse transcriptase isoform X2 [Impatiens glandulifera]